MRRRSAPPVYKSPRLRPSLLYRIVYVEYPFGMPNGNGGRVRETMEMTTSGVNRAQALSRAVNELLSTRPGYEIVEPWGIGLLLTRAEKAFLSARGHLIKRLGSGKPCVCIESIEVLRDPL